MTGRHFQLFLVAGLLAAAIARADLVTARIGIEPTGAGKLVIAGDGDKPAWTIQADLSGLGRGTKIYRARLYVPRSQPLSGGEDWALTAVKVTASDRRAAKLVGPWYDCFDVTGWVQGGGTTFHLEAPAMIDAKRIGLAVEYEGRLAGPPKQPTGLRVLHRAGQTFITWLEMDKRISGEPVTWGVLKKALDEMDAKHVVRYRVYRHTERITARTIASAELLAEVKPLSCYNVEGRSVEWLISMHRRRAIDDIPFARMLARTGYFGRYHVDMPEVVVHRFVVPASSAAGDGSGKPLPLGSGLYVHNPTKAGKAHYAVATCVDGVTNTLDFTPANATAGPLAETVGAGEPVFQAAGTLKVFYDYPGQRRYYVQWTSPPLSNLPNRYYNWAIYLPAERPEPTPVRIVFTKDRFMRPGTIHRKDTILVSGRDGPVWSFWYGYHEALGTLKSFRQGAVRPYTKRRMFAFIDWVVKEFNGDPKRLSAVGGTDALYYGVKHGEKFAYVLTNGPDPNPQVTPAATRIDNYIKRRPRAQMERVWGKVEWKIPGEDGKPIWDEFDLIRCVAGDPKRDLAFLSMGPAALSAPWPRQVEFMKTLWKVKQPFTATFYWGGGYYLPIPEGKVGAKDAFDFALDIPMLALRNNTGDRGLRSPRWTEGKAGYWGGGRIADGRRWLADFVDSPDRFEITIHGGGRVVYAGGGTSDVTPRRTKNFKPKPGEKFRWENVPLGPRSRSKPQSGEVVADEHGLVTIPQVNFRDPSRLKIHRAK